MIHSSVFGNHDFSVTGVSKFFFYALEHKWTIYEFVFISELHVPECPAHNHHHIFSTPIHDSQKSFLCLERKTWTVCANCSLDRAPRAWGVICITVLFCQGYQLNLRSLRSGLGCCCKRFSWHLKCVAWFLACLINRRAHWNCDKPFWFLWSAPTRLGKRSWHVWKEISNS